MFLDSLKELVNEIASMTARKIEHLVRSSLNRLQSSNTKAVYTETEAAEFLGLSKSQIQKYRKTGLINFIHYPSTVEVQTETRNAIYGYFLTDLMNFAQTYHRQNIKVREVYKFAKIIDVNGLDIEE